VLKSEFDSATAANMNNVAVLVAVLSRDFIQSVVASIRLKGFTKLPPIPSSTAFQDSESPADACRATAPAARSDRYDMYQLDAETGIMKEYSDFFTMKLKNNTG